MSLFIIRADASLEMGTGHVMRCLTLANALREKGHKCHFLCRDHRGNLANAIMQQGFGLTLLEKPKLPVSETGGLAHAAWLGCSQKQDAEQVLEVLASLEVAPVDCLIVDHYALDITWEKALRGHASCLVVIDDLYDRQHDCDMLLNQNLGATPDHYKNRVPQNCQILAGTRYTMLRAEFANCRQRSLEHKSKSRERQDRQLLISMGGVDPDNYTGRLLQKIRSRPPKGLDKIVVVIGEMAPHRASVEQLAAELPIDTKVKTAVRNMAELMAGADLSCGAAGSTSWERCCLGLPGLLFVTADNQIQSARALVQRSAVILADIDADAESLTKLLERFLYDADFYAAMSQAAAALCDGKGVERVARHLEIQLSATANNKRRE